MTKKTIDELGDEINGSPSITIRGTEYLLVEANLWDKLADKILTINQKPKKSWSEMSEEEHWRAYEKWKRAAIDKFKFGRND